jgi:hypothetical protein
MRWVRADERQPFWQCCYEVAGTMLPALQETNAQNCRPGAVAEAGKLEQDAVFETRFVA